MGAGSSPDPVIISGDVPTMGPARETAAGRLRSFSTLHAPDTWCVEPGTNGKTNGLFKAGSPGSVRWQLVLFVGIGVGVGVTALFYYLPVFTINYYATLYFFLSRDSI
jgi:hypothetical protein